MVKLAFLSFLLLLVTGCAPDPRKEAEAEAIRASIQITATAAAQSAQARQQDLERQQVVTDAWKDARPVVTERMAQAASVAGYALIAALTASILFVAIFFARVGHAYANRAEAAAENARWLLTVIDGAPVLLDPKSGHIVHLGTGQVINPALPAPPHPQMTAGHYALAMADRLGKHAATISKNERSQAADALPGIAGSVPQVLAAPDEDTY